MMMMTINIIIIITIVYIEWSTEVQKKNYESLYLDIIFIIVAFFLLEQEVGQGKVGVPGQFTVNISEWAEGGARLATEDIQIEGWNCTGIQK